MFALRQNRFEIVSEIDDHVAAFESLYGSVDQLAFAIDVFFVNLLSNRFADFLHQYLLGSLSRDAAHFFLRQRYLKHVADFDLVAG